MNTETSHQGYLDILDGLPMDPAKLDSKSIDILFGYSDLNWTNLLKHIKKGQAIPIPSSTVKGGYLAIRLVDGQLCCESERSLTEQRLTDMAMAYAVEQWKESLINVNKVIDVCTAYIMHIANLQIVGRGYIGTNADLEWLNKYGEMSPSKIDEKIVFASHRNYAFEELRQAKFDTNARDASFNVAYYCADCGRNITMIGNGCDCGKKFLYKPSDFSICLTCQSGPFNFGLTQKMRVVFESQGHIFTKACQDGNSKISFF